ncbi:hypothetical protein AKJ16_DCAP23054 [Drosera capensis]
MKLEEMSAEFALEIKVLKGSSGRIYSTIPISLQGLKKQTASSLSCAQTYGLTLSYLLRQQLDKIAFLELTIIYHTMLPRQDS